jgi:recombination protein RecA
MRVEPIAFKTFLQNNHKKLKDLQFGSEMEAAWLAELEAQGKKTYIPTGFPGIDRVMGPGGFQRGRFAQIYGERSTGKTTLAAQVMANVQATGGRVVYWDAEFTYSSEFLAGLGVRADELILIQEKNAEDGLEKLLAILEVGEKNPDYRVDLIVIDSVKMLVPKSRLDSEVGKGQMALVARFVSEMTQRLLASIHINQVAVTFINHLVNTMDSYRSPSGAQVAITQPGAGKALEYASSLNIKLRNVGGAKDDETVGHPIGRPILLLVEKNKSDVPLREVELRLEFGSGFDIVSDLAATAEQLGVIERTGAWYRYGKYPKLNGLKSLLAWIQADSGIAAAIRQDVNGAAQQERLLRQSNARDKAQFRLEVGGFARPDVMAQLVDADLEVV